MNPEGNLVEILESDRSNFDFFFSQIEEFKLKYGEEFPRILDIEARTTALDRLLQNIGEEAERVEYTDETLYSKNLTIINASTKLLKEFFITSLNPKGLKAISEQLELLIFTVEKAATLQNADEVSKYFDHQKFDKNIPSTLISDNLRAIKKSLSNFKNLLSRLFKLPSISNFVKKNKKIKNNYIWDIEIKLEGSEFNAEKVSFFLWSFSKMFSAIEGANITIKEFVQGSLIVRMRAYFKDSFAKEVTKEVLNNVRQSVLLSNSNTETLEQKKEDNAAKTASDGNKQTEEQNNELKNRKLRAEIESMELDNVLKKIKVIKNLSEFGREGVLSIDSNFEISINSILYLGKDGKRYIKGGDMDKMDDGTDEKKSEK